MTVSFDCRMNSAERSLLDLLKFSVSGKATYGNHLLEMGNGWAKIFRIATHQGVSAMLLDAIESLPAEMRPEKPLLLKWVGQTMMMERMYAKHKERIAALAGLYKRHGIRMLLLKGYGCSLCYPKPEHRPTGDIDIYLFGRQEDADQIIEKELDTTVRREYHKHSTFDFNGVEVENHAKFIDDVSHRSNIRFEQILFRTLKKYPCVESPIDNVLLPSPTFNALFLLRHTGEHFASNEITLRHILDVGLFFRRYHSDIDWNFVFNVYESERMQAFFNGIATVCVENIGIAPECFASDDRHHYIKNLPLAERILSDVFAEKERLPMSTAGIHTARQKMSYFIGKTRRWWRNRWKYKLVYNESLTESFLWLAKNRLKSF